MKLCGRADAVVENSRPGDRARLAPGYDDVKAVDLPAPGEHYHCLTEDEAA